MSPLGHSLPTLPAPAPANVRHAANGDQHIAAPGLVAMGQEATLHLLIALPINFVKISLSRQFTLFATLA
jgi:hypothetical protein